MTSTDITTLKDALQQARQSPHGTYVAFRPDAQTCVEVIGVEPHPTTGEPVVVWADEGEWTPLNEVELRDFALITRLG